MRGKAKKVFGLFGGKDDEEIGVEKVQPASPSEVKSFEKAVEALKKALEAVKAELEKGKVPAAKAIEKARKALIQELAGTVLGTQLGLLQRLLRSGLLELVAALGSKGASASALVPAVDRCLQSLGEAVREGNGVSKFWESMI
jgi:molecular chaperone GrpE (heat shock protein)